MKKTLLLIFVVALAGILSGGCYSVNVSTKGDRTMCLANNSCLLLFGFIPIASGDIDGSDDTSVVFFKDTTTLANNLRLVDRAMRAEHATKTRDVSSYRTDETILILILRRTTLRTSAELVDLMPL